MRVNFVHYVFSLVAIYGFMETMPCISKGKIVLMYIFFKILHFDVLCPTSDGSALPLDDTDPVRVDWAIGFSCGTSEL